jgi:hypothetical protein
LGIVPVETLMKNKLRIFKFFKENGVNIVEDEGFKANDTGHRGGFACKYRKRWCMGIKKADSY